MKNKNNTPLYAIIILLSVAVIVGATALIVRTLGSTSEPDDTSEHSETESSPPDTEQDETTADSVAETEDETEVPVPDSETVSPDTDDENEILVIEYETPVTMYALYNVNARMADTADSDIMGVLYQGDAVIVTGETSNKWYRIVYRTYYTAYVKFDLLTTDSSVAAVDIEYFDIPKTMYTISNVNVRASHSTNSVIYEMFAIGTEVNVIAKTENGWFRIEYGEGFAYIKEEYLSDEMPVIEVETEAESET